MKPQIPMSDEIEVLLDDLCVRLGFCLPPEQYERLVTTPPSNPAEFTNAVFLSEGMSPRTADDQLYKHVLSTVQRVFENAKPRAQ
jgi:hypothetical protein